MRRRQRPLGVRDRLVICCPRIETWVANLKPVDDFDAFRVESRLAGETSEQPR
jgi:hypothetical protein